MLQRLLLLTGEISLGFYLHFIAVSSTQAEGLQHGGDACQLAGLALPWLAARLCPERPALTPACDLLQDSAGRPLGCGSFRLLCHDTCRPAGLDMTGKGPVSLGEVGAGTGPGAAMVS